MSDQLKYDSVLTETGGRSKVVPPVHYDFFPGVVCVMNTQLAEVTFINKRITEVLGYTVEEFNAFPQNWLNIVYPDDYDVFNGWRQQILTTTDHSDILVARFNHKDGSCKYLEVTASVTESNGTAGSVFLFFRNVTDEIRIRDEAAANRQLFDETERLILFGSWSWTPKSNKMTWTDGMCHLLEYEPAEIENVNLDFFLKHVVPEYAESLQSLVLNAIATNTEFEGECVIRTRTGKEKYVYTRGKPLFGADGTFRRYLGITRDITNKKNAEKERDRRIRELNRSNKELEEFAYVASHDMHEPLRKILTFGQKISSKYAPALGEDGQVYLDRIVAAANNMRSLIDNLLEFSRISRGARAFVMTDLKEILKQVMSDQELRIEETGTRIRVRDLPAVEIVPTEMRQLFNNLLSNAIKFRKKDVAPLITISSHKLTHREKAEYLIPFNQTFYRISVQDNGIGFDAVYSEKIFEIFQRLNGKSEYTGSGIGLAICKKIVQSHDGIIYATGELGVGSTFSIILPENQFH